MNKGEKHHRVIYKNYSARFFFNDRFLVQQFFSCKEMSWDTIIRWRLINEKTQREKTYKEVNGGVAVVKGWKIDWDKSPGREQNKSALGSLLKPSMM